VRTLRGAVACGLLLVVSACSNPGSHASTPDQSFTYTASSTDGGAGPSGPSVVGIGPLPDCGIVRTPVEQLGLVLRNGVGSDTCLFTETQDKRQGISVTISAADAQTESTARSNLTSPVTIGRASVEGRAVDGQWTVQTTCENLDLLMTSTGSIDYAGRAVTPVETFLDCPIAN
jgi:hypothetical protein